MNEPLVCEGTDLDVLIEEIRAEHGEAADILYQDSVRRGGVMGFFAQEVHRLVYRVNETTDDNGTDVITNVVADPAAVADAGRRFEELLAQRAQHLATAEPADTAVSEPVAVPDRPSAASVYRAKGAASVAAKLIANVADPTPFEETDQDDWFSSLLEPAEGQQRNTPSATAELTIAPTVDKLIEDDFKDEFDDEFEDDFKDVDTEGGFIAEAESRVAAYAFPLAEPSTPVFNHKPAAPVLRATTVSAPAAYPIPDEAVSSRQDALSIQESEPAVTITETLAAEAEIAEPRGTELFTTQVPSLEAPALMTAQERFAELLKTMAAEPAADEVVTVAETTETVQKLPTEAALVASHEIVDFPPVSRHRAPEVMPEPEPADETRDAPTSAPLSPASTPHREDALVVNLPATGTPDARARLDILTRLRDVGVPSYVSPSNEAANIYEALDGILSELPAVPTAPRQPGDVLVVIGEIGPALRAAQSVARTLRLRDGDIWVADLQSQPVIKNAQHSTGAARTIENPRQAARIRAELVEADVPSVVVLASDGAETDPNDPWLSEMLEALRPTAVWACVDATRKTGDTIAQLAQLGDLDALVVHKAGISSSPASVWDIGIPVALLDTRPADVATWAGLLLSLLASTGGQTATTQQISDESATRARHRSA